MSQAFCPSCSPAQFLYPLVLLEPSTISSSVSCHLCGISHGHLPTMALCSTREGGWRRVCSHGDLGVSRSTATTWLGLDLGPAGRPSPALPQDAWRWIEITSQELALSCSPLGPRVASGFPVHFLARRIFYPLSSELGHSSVCPYLGRLGSFWPAAEVP